MGYNRQQTIMKQKLLSIFLVLAASVGTLFAQSGTCGDNLTWTLNTETGTLTISGTGAMTNYSYDSYTRPWNVYSTSIKTVIIEDGVTSIGVCAFYECSKLTSVTIPNSVTSIGNDAFRNCSNLTSITIPNSVTSIEQGAFYGCSNLTSVTIGESVTSIGYYAFKGCSKLTTVIWNTKKYNDFSASNTPFYYYNSSGSSDNFDLRAQITSFTFGDNVEAIPAYLCSGMSKLTAVTIPNSVTSIGAFAFSGCNGLTSVSNLSSVTSIGNSAFYNCSNITSDLNLINVETIGQQAFYGCSGLTSATIGNGVTSIGKSAFYGCTYLEDITIGSSINVDNSIGYQAFYGCRYLLSVTCKAVYPPVINANVFEGCGVLGGIDLYVPEKSVARYKKADVWSEFNIVGKDLSVDDPTNPTNPEDGKYTITWQDEDGNVIKTDEVEQGTTPVYTGTIPTKPATNEYTYEFAGWLPKIQPATKDMYYTTFFERNKIETPVYTVNINGENCSLNINNQYPEGTIITLEAVADECFEFRQWSDGNKDNPRTITVTANTNLTAEFNKVRYTVTGQPSTGGKVQIRKQ